MENPVMILCDIGNTSYHFLKDDADYKESVKTFNPSSVKGSVYYICVNSEVKKTLDILDNWIDLAESVDFSKYYKSMGIDRIAACEALDDGVIIDAGSAITVDVVNNGVFDGGFIYPGVNAMRESYKNISPALDYEFNFELDLNTLPKNSRDAISYGYLKTLYAEVSSYKKEIILTGGDSDKLSKIFPNAKINNRLVFEGMRKILKS